MRSSSSLTPPSPVLHPPLLTGGGGAQWAGPGVGEGAGPDWPPRRGLLVQRQVGVAMIGDPPLAPEQRQSAQLVSDLDRRRRRKRIFRSANKEPFLIHVTLSLAADLSPAPKPISITSKPVSWDVV